MKLRAAGIDEYEADGIRVKFSPTFPTGTHATNIDADHTDEWIAKQELENAMERFRDTAKNSEEDLLWST